MYKSYRNCYNSQESKKLNHANITKIEEEEQDSEDDQELEDDMKISDVEDFQQEQFNNSQRGGDDMMDDEDEINGEQ